MALTATQIANSTAGRYDVELKFYGGNTYSLLTLSQYTSGAIDPSTAGWTDITSLVTDAGNLTYERAGNTKRFTASISGTSYSATYFGQGKAILCLRRILIAGVQTVPASGTYELWFLGQILSGGHRDDYKHGGAWQRSIGGMDALLQRSTAPRLTAGRMDLLSGITPTAKSTLLNPALEAGTGEFPGTLVQVSASNTTDGNLNTLWISNEAPHHSVISSATAIFNKVFFKPLAGYNQAKTWWIELDNPGEFVDGDWYLQNSAGEILYFMSGDYGKSVRDDEGTHHVIIAASASDFEAYTGGAQGGAVVFDAKLAPNQGTFNSLTTGRDGTFTLDPDADYLLLFQREGTEPPSTIKACIVWNQDGAAVSIPGDEPWTGGALDVSDDVCPPGSGVRCRPGENGGAAADYEITDMMIPGDDYDDDHIEWLLYTLPERTNALSGAVSAGATSITLNSTLGLRDSGDAICEVDKFAYTGRTTTTLTGVTGIGDHADGAAVYQCIDDISQFGWPCSQLELLRPANPALAQITAGRIYTLTSNLTPPNTPGTEGWEADYDGSVLNIGAPNTLDDIYDYGFALTAPAGGPRYVQYMLIVFDKMSDAGRAKLNETRLFLAQTQIDSSGLGDIGDIRAYGLARYIFNLAGVTATLTDGTSAEYGPFIGEHATAIAPYPQVLDDLGRITGCVMDWSLAGTPAWNPDMWWPMFPGTTQYELYGYLDATYIRGQAQYSGSRPNEVGVKVHAKTPDGLHEYTAQYPPTMTTAQQRIEIDDAVTPWSSQVTQLAKTQYYKAGLNYTDGSQELTFTLKGPGEWLKPEQFIAVASINSSGKIVTQAGYSGTYDLPGWLVESVTWEWGRQGAFRTWAATAKCRRYWR